MRIAFFSFVIMLGFVFQVNAQSLIQGQITDSNGSPVSGAIVSVSGTFIATSTDAKGNYKLKISSQAEIAVVSSMLGFISSSKKSKTVFAFSFKSCCSFVKVIVMKLNMISIFI